MQYPTFIRNLCKKPDFGELLRRCVTRIRTYTLVRLRSCVTRSSHFIQNLAFYRGSVTYRHIRGFSLLELSIVVMIIGLMVASILPAITQQTLKERQQELVQKMDTIEEALKAFRQKNGRLPCPAQAALAIDNANFALEAANPGTCTGGTPAATSPASDVVVGVIPVRTLGLDDGIVFDPWDRTFTYMVDARMTEDSPQSFTTYEVDNSSIGNITVKTRDEINDTLSDITTKAIAVVLGHGPNGHGAYMRSGVRYSSGNTDADELENCNCTSTATSGTDNATFVITLQSTSGASTTTGFDDVLRYYTRGSFMVPADIK